MLGTAMWTFSTHKTSSFVQQFDWIIITKLNFALHLDHFNFKLNFKVSLVSHFNLAVNCLEWLKRRIDFQSENQILVNIGHRFQDGRKDKSLLNKIWKTLIECVPFPQRRLSRSNRKLIASIRPYGTLKFRAALCGNLAVFSIALRLHIFRLYLRLLV
jgi:hypothetical protein